MIETLRPVVDKLVLTGVARDGARRYLLAERASARLRSFGHTAGSLEVRVQYVDTRPRIERDADRNFWMTAEEAKGYGLIDEIFAGRERKVPVAVPTAP